MDQRYYDDLIIFNVISNLCSALIPGQRGGTNVFTYPHSQNILTTYTRTWKRKTFASSAKNAHSIFCSEIIFFPDQISRYELKQYIIFVQISASESENWFDLIKNFMDRFNNLANEPPLALASWVRFSGMTTRVSGILCFWLICI